MRALVYYHSIPRYLASGLLALLHRKRFFPCIAPLKLRDVHFPPPIPNLDTEWVLLKTRLCGICGSDLNLLRGTESLLLEPYASFPAILGHEVVAEVEQSPRGSGLAPGDRVIVEPVLYCTIRGLPLCHSCAQGDTNLCERYTEGYLPSGPIIGYNATVGGGMAERLAVHVTQCHKVPQDMPDKTAVLVDSLASALQPTLDNFPDPNDQVVVYGAGIIGQHLIRCLRALGFTGRLVAVARHGFQLEAAQSGGADQVLISPSRFAIGEALGARFLPTTFNGGNLEGGADLFFDCIGSSQSFQEGLLALRARGRLVMVATASTIKSVDLSSLWFRQLTITGTACYSHSTHQQRPIHTYRMALELLASTTYPTHNLLTHTFRLDDYAIAFQTLFNKSTHHSMKAAFDLR
ncbi:Alcohol dehydrogenase GroES domain protein [Desulfovibrionales bacterium]